MKEVPQSYQWWPHLNEDKKLHNSLGSETQPSSISDSAIPAMADMQILWNHFKEGCCRCGPSNTMHSTHLHECSKLLP